MDSHTVWPRCGPQCVTRCVLFNPVGTGGALSLIITLNNQAVMVRTVLRYTTHLLTFLLLKHGMITHVILIISGSVRKGSNRSTVGFQWIINFSMHCIFQLHYCLVNNICHSCRTERTVMMSFLFLWLTWTIWYRNELHRFKHFITV